MTPVQIIKENDKPKFAVIDWEVFLKFQEFFEEAEDIADAKEILSDPKTEIIPLDVSTFIENPIKALRIEYSLTQKQLAEMIGVSQPYIAKVEKAENPPKDFIEKVRTYVSHNNF